MPNILPTRNKIMLLKGRIMEAEARQKNLITSIAGLERELQEKSEQLTPEYRAYITNKIELWKTALAEHEIKISNANKQLEEIENAG